MIRQRLKALAERVRKVIDPVPEVVPLEDLPPIRPPPGDVDPFRRTEEIRAWYLDGRAETAGWENTDALPEAPAETTLSYVVGEPCVDCKFGDCVEVCPVDCFYQGEDQLYIDPEACIRCHACVPACPVGAIFPEDDPPEDPGWKHPPSYYVRKMYAFDYRAAEPVTSKQDVVPGPLRPPASDPPAGR